MHIAVALTSRGRLPTCAAQPRLNAYQQHRLQRRATGLGLSQHVDAGAVLELGCHMGWQQAAAQRERLQWWQQLDGDRRACRFTPPLPWQNAAGHNSLHFTSIARGVGIMSTEQENARLTVLLGELLALGELPNLGLVLRQNQQALHQSGRRNACQWHQARCSACQWRQT